MSSFGAECPYRHAQEQLGLPVHDDRTFYRIVNYEENRCCFALQPDCYHDDRESANLSRVTTGDSETMEDTYDGKHMIDATQHRDCGCNCLCRTLRFPCIDKPKSLAFVAKKANSLTRTIHIHSDAMLRSLCGLGVFLWGRQIDISGPDYQEKMINHIMVYMDRDTARDSPENGSRAICELTLLADFLSHDNQFPRTMNEPKPLCLVDSFLIPFIPRFSPFPVNLGLYVRSRMHMHLEAHLRGPGRQPDPSNQER